MAYTTKYRIEFDTIAGESIKIDIQEDPFAGDITLLKGMSASLRYTDSDQSKKPSIKKSKLSFNVVSGSITAIDLLTNEDTELKVLLYLNNILQWSGWLDSGGLEELFLDPPYELQLEAHDGLLLLNNSTIKNLSNEELWGNYRISDLFAFCFNQTKLNLNYWTWINIYPENKTTRTAINPERDPFYYTHLNSSTFEGDTTFEILKKIIVSFNCQLFQARGEWHIVYIEDWIRNLGLDGTEWNASGVAQGIAEDQRFNIDIGINELHKLVDADASATWQTGNKSVKLNYIFNVPKLIRNIDLNESTFIGYITPPNSNRLNVAKYTFTHWASTGGDTYVIADLDLDQDSSTEVNRRIQFVKSAGVNTKTVTSSAINVNAGDYFKFSFNYGLITKSGTPALFLIIKKINVSPNAAKWLGEDGKWYNSLRIIFVDRNGSATLSQPSSFNIESVQPINSSVDYLEITFSCGMAFAATDANLYFINDIQFDYSAFAALPNRIARGQFTKVSQSGNFLSDFEDEVFLSDSRNKVFKGTILDENKSVLRYWLHNGITEAIRFSTLIANATYKMWYRDFILLDFDAKNIKTGSYLVSPLDTLIFNEIANSEFCFGNLEIDLPNNRFTGSVIELHDTNDFSESGTVDFKFIEPNAEIRKKERIAVSIKLPLGSSSISSTGGSRLFS